MSAAHAAVDTVTIPRAEYVELLQLKADAAATRTASEFDLVFAKLAAGLEYAPARAAVEAMSAQMNADYVAAVRSSVEPAAFQNVDERLVFLFKSHPVAQHWSALAKGCGDLFASLAIVGCFISLVFRKKNSFVVPPLVTASCVGQRAQKHTAQRL